LALSLALAVIIYRYLKPSS